MKKEVRGQITIFIIIAVLIISVVALFFMFKGEIGKKESVAPESASIKNFVQECLDETSKSVVFDIVERGGYEDPSKVSSTIVFNIPYYIKNNKNLMPSKEKIQEEISKYILKQMDLCIDDFALFPEYEITKGEIIVEIKIEPERVLVNAEYPLTIIKGETKSKIKEFDSEVPVRLGIVYEAVAGFIIQSISYEGVCINCLLDVSSKNNLKSEFSNYDNNTIIFTINDPQSKLNNKELVYVFANEY